MKTNIKQAIEAFHEMLWRDHGVKCLTCIEDENGFIVDLISSDMEYDSGHLGDDDDEDDKDNDVVIKVSRTLH